MEREYLLYLERLPVGWSLTSRKADISTLTEDSTAYSANALLTIMKSEMIKKTSVS